MEQPLISVVMPVYQVEPYIGASVRSVCRQTFRDFELILVDDGTRDASIETAERVLNENPVPYRVLHRHNGGVSSARNAGIKVAAGTFVICLDPDDSIHPRTFELLVRQITEQVDVLGFSFSYVSQTPEAYDPVDNYGVIDYGRTELAEAFFTRSVQLAVPTFLMRKSFLTEHCLYYDESCFYSEDQLYIWKMIEQIRCFRFLTCPLYAYLLREGSTMTASGVEKIKNGYQKFRELDHWFAVTHAGERLGIDTALVLPRWMFGVLHSTAEFQPFSVFRQVSSCLDWKKELPKLRYFPDKRIFPMVRLLQASRYGFYLVSRILR